jgi:hypothetical protein
MKAVLKKSENSDAKKPFASDPEITEGTANVYEYIYMYL